MESVFVTGPFSQRVCVEECLWGMVHALGACEIHGWCKIDGPSFWWA